MARPRSVMTPEVCETVRRAVEVGLPALRAAYAAGVTPSAVKSHRKRNPAFATALKKAEAMAELRQVTVIQRAADGQHRQEWVDKRKVRHTIEARAPVWQAAAWILERRFAERWARKEIIHTRTDRPIEADPRFE